MMGIATDLARGKMYDIEEQLLKDGFTDTDQSQTDAKPFDDRGLAEHLLQLQGRAGRDARLRPADRDVARTRRLGRVCGLGQQQLLGSAFGSAYGSAFGSDALGGFQNSALGGMLGMFGGASGGVTRRPGRAR